MGFFDFLKQPDINRGIQEFMNMEGAVLLDVRTPQEYREGHIPGSKNVPLHQLDKVEDVAENKDGALFVYCYSGARSGRATAQLRRMGYTNVQNIGGISAYFGNTDR